MLSPPNRNFADFNDRTISQCFSCLSFLTIESDCKNMKYFRHGKKKLPPVVKTIGGNGEIGVLLLFVLGFISCSQRGLHVVS